MSVLDNEGHDPQGLGNTPRPKDIREFPEMSQEQVETLRTYASILEKPSRVFDPVLMRHVMRGPGEILQAAIIALRFHAAAVEQNAAPEGK